MVSLVYATLALAMSVVAVSIFLVRPSQGLTSERALLDAFVQADADQSGDLDREELLIAISRMGVDSARIRTILETIEKMHKHDCGVITFPEARCARAWMVY